MSLYHVLFSFQLLGIFTPNCCFHGNQILGMYGKNYEGKHSIDILNE